MYQLIKKIIKKILDNIYIYKKPRFKLINIELKKT